jgi:flagellar basal-body rod protein FlgC
MSLFGSIGISASGIDASQTWINAAAGNIANAQDAVSTNQAAYQAETPVLTPVTSTVPGTVGDGVTVSAVDLGSAAGIVTYDPSNPLSNAQGLVRYPDVSTPTQLVDLVEAQNSYQANAAALQRATTAYQSIITLRG